MYRNSSLKINDILGTPCFMAFNKKDVKDGSNVLCAFSIQEKEIWLQTITNNSK